MVEQQREALVIVERDDYDAAVDELRAVGTVTQLLPPRLVLVAVAPAPAAGGGPRPAVTGVAWYDEDVPEEVVEGLSEQERMFVAAWRSRRAPKVRPGDGQPWDVPGRLPPDRPPGHGRGER